MATLPENIQTLNGWANDCRLILWGLEDHLDYRDLIYNPYVNLDDVAAVATANRTVISDLIEAMQYFVYGQTSSFNYTMWQIVHSGLYDWEHDLSLVKWIEWYIDAKDDHRSAHRLLLDAYQASMYDKPFDKEYHASWIQRFRSWE